MNCKKCTHYNACQHIIVPEYEELVPCEFYEINKMTSKRKWLSEVSQFLQDNGFENASKAIDCKYDL